MISAPPSDLGGPRSPKSLRSLAILGINRSVPLGALLLIILLTYVSYLPQRADTLGMNELGWLTPPVGMYAAELFPGQTPYYRWTSSDAVLPLPNPGGEVLVQFIMGGHPGGTPNAAIRVGPTRIALDVPAAIRRYRLLLPPSNQERLLLQVVAPPLVAEGDNRPLGLLLGPAKVYGGGGVPSAVLFGAVLLFVGGYLFARRSGYAPWAITGVLLPIIALALIWNAASGWRYAVTGSATLLMAALSLAALAYEQLLPQRSLTAAAAAAIIGAVLPWAVTQPLAPDVLLIGAALVAVAGYIWLRTVGAPVLAAYAGMLILGVAALMAQRASGIAPLAPGLMLILFSVSWLALNLIPRAEQVRQARVATDSAWIALSAAVIITIGIHLLYIWSLPVVGKPDISFIWRDSVGLAAGNNPYERVLTGNMQTNDKYATYFPLFYLLGALVDRLGLRTFDSWITFWRVIFLACSIGTALLIFTLLIKSGRALLAGFAAAFWLLHRWTLSSDMSTDIDFLAIFFLILSLTLLYTYRLPAAQLSGSGPAAGRRASADRYFWGSLLCLSLSLAIKQIAIFFVPLYCIWAWHISRAPGDAPRPTGWRQTRIARTAIALLVILSIPLLTGLPFLAWNAPGFIRSILFSATRSPSLNSSLLSASWILGQISPPFTGITSRLVLALALLGIYAAVARREVQMFAAGLLTLAVFIGFNPLSFPQYLTWLVPLIPLVACDLPLDRGADAKDRP